MPDWSGWLAHWYVRSRRSTVWISVVLLRGSFGNMLRRYKVYRYWIFISQISFNLSIIVLCLSGWKMGGANKTKAFVKGHSWRQNEDYVGGATSWSSNCLYNICKCKVILSIRNNHRLYILGSTEVIYKCNTPQIVSYTPASNICSLCVYVITKSFTGHLKILN